MKYAAWSDLGRHWSCCLCHFIFVGESLPAVCPGCGAETNYEWRYTTGTEPTTDTGAKP